MHYLCPKCGETYAEKPADGMCRICDAPLVADSETHAAEPRGDKQGLPSPKRRL